MRATAHIFCARLQGREAPSPHTVEAVVFSDARYPEVEKEKGAAGSCITVAVPPLPTAVVRAVVSFSHPVASLPSAEHWLDVEGGTVDEVRFGGGGHGRHCAEFTVDVRVPTDPWEGAPTRLCVGVRLESVCNFWGSSCFPAFRNCTTIHLRPAGRLFAPFMVSAGDVGLTTADAEPVLLALFSADVNVAPSNFLVTGPPSGAVAAVVAVPGSPSARHLALRLPQDYYGSVTVAMTGHAVDAQAAPTLPVAPLTFVRVRSPQVTSPAYQLAAGG